MYVPMPWGEVTCPLRALPALCLEWSLARLPIAEQPVGKLQISATIPKQFSQVNLRVMVDVGEMVCGGSFAGTIRPRLSIFDIGHTHPVCTTVDRAVA